MVHGDLARILGSRVFNAPPQSVARRRWYRGKHLTLCINQL